MFGLRMQVRLAMGLMAAGSWMILRAQAGPFTAAQADAGHAIYQERCSSCHLPNLQGSGDAPPLAGLAFTSSWRDRKASDLIAFIQSTMPPGSAGSLGEQACVNAVAYILQSNNV